MEKIEGYNYYINEQGDVFNSKGRKLVPRLHTGGYLRVNLCRDGLHKDFYIHRLVAFAYLDNPNNYNEVNHKDSDKKNNLVSNLEWCNGSMNHHHSLFAGTKTRGEDSSRSKLTEREVREIRDIVNPDTKGLSIKYQVTRGCIRLILKRKTWRWLV
jgi:hypothetical protein